MRWSAGDAALARIYAAQLIGLKPDVILTSSTNNLKAIQEATSTIPVVFVQVSDPVAQGFVANITKPGGNITGFTNIEYAIAAALSPALDSYIATYRPVLAKGLKSDAMWLSRKTGDRLNSIALRDLIARRTEQRLG